jgi:peroxiredoxin
MKKTAAILLLFLSSTSFGQTLQEKIPDKTDTSSVGKQAPEFIATTLSGKDLKLSSLRGKIVVINFWFTGCPPCLQEIDILNDLVRKYSKRKVVFIAISVVDKPEKLKAFLKRIPFDYQMVTADPSVVQRYKVRIYPTNLVVDSDGRILFSGSGFHKNIGLVLSQEIEKHL